MAKEQAKEAREYAKVYGGNHKQSKEFKKAYFDSPNGTKKWLDDMYGNDWHDKDYMKEVFDIGNVHKHANTEMKRQYSELLESENNSEKKNNDLAKKWEAEASYFFNTPADKLSKSDIKRAKKYISTKRLLLDAVEDT